MWKVIFVLLISFEAKASCFYSVNILPEQVYDGDTIQDVDFRMDFGITANRTIRILGINAAELRRGPISERRKGLKARNRLRTLIKKCRRIRVSVQGSDSFGRALGKVFCGNRSLGKQLLDEGLAKPYKE